MERLSLSVDLEPGRRQQQISVETQKIVEWMEKTNYGSGHLYNSLIDATGDAEGDALARRTCQ